MSSSDLTIYERMAVQMQAVVPLVRDLQRILGEDAVNQALEERLKQDMDAARKGKKADVDMSTFAAGVDQYAAGNALDYEIVRSDDRHFDMNVHRCAYAEMMDRLGAREIGHLLICNHDFPMAERAGLVLERTQTRMQGAPFCDFRYRKKGA